MEQKINKKTIETIGKIYYTKIYFIKCNRFSNI